MFETSGVPLWSHQKHSALESSAIRHCMIAPANIRQHEILPASVNPNLGLNGFGIPGWSENGLANEGSGSIGNSVFRSTHGFGASNQTPLEQISPFPQVDEKPRVYQPQYPAQRKFLVFDHTGNETRMMFSSLYSTVAPNLCPVWNSQVASAKPFDTSTSKFLSIGQARNDERVCAKTPVISEESGENESLDDEEHEMREDTDEINALLYSDDDHDDDYDDEDDDDDDAVSSGRSPLSREGNHDKHEERGVSNFDDEAVVSSMSLKRRKTLDGGHEKLALLNTTTTEEQRSAAPAKKDTDDFVSALDEGSSATLGSKRPRKDKIRDTLKALESLLPGLNNKDPIVILDEAIRYLKCLKHNAESMSFEDSDGSGCYETSN